MPPDTNSSRTNPSTKNGAPIGYYLPIKILNNLFKRNHIHHFNFATGTTKSPAVTLQLMNSLLTTMAISALSALLIIQSFKPTYVLLVIQNSHSMSQGKA